VPPLLVVPLLEPLPVEPLLLPLPELELAPPELAPLLLVFPPSFPEPDC
jgi:hypothetical protein